MRVAWRGRLGDNGATHNFDRTDTVMQHASPLPSFLIDRFHAWKADEYSAQEAHFHDLVDNGQHPHSMLISCCDSRVNGTDIMGAAAGEFFIHRNIANFVPPHNPDNGEHGTAAALLYAVTALGVQHITIMGHAHCGGVQGCHDMCSGKNEALKDPNNAVGRWVSHIEPAFARLAGTDKADDIHAMEQEAVLVSLENLLSYPFIAEAVASGKLALHGLWHDIREGALHHYNAEKGAFEAL